MGIAEGQSTSPELSSPATAPFGVIKDCVMKILDALEHVPAIPIDTSDLSALTGSDSIEPTILHSNLQTIRTNWGEIITDWAGSM